MSNEILHGALTQRVLFLSAAFLSVLKSPPSASRDMGAK